MRLTMSFTERNRLRYKSNCVPENRVIKESRNRQFESLGAFTRTWLNVMLRYVCPSLKTVPVLTSEDSSL